MIYLKSKGVMNGRVWQIRLLGLESSDSLHGVRLGSTD